MSAHFKACEEHLQEAVNEVFDADPQVQVVGISRQDGGFGYKAVKNAAKILPASVPRTAKRLPKSIKRIPVLLDVVEHDVTPHAAVSQPLAASFVPEQQFHRPLALGLQIQNVDDDTRQRVAGALGPNTIVIGTLGGFVTLGSGGTAILSNNHVLAGENRGLKGQDRILQPGDLVFASAQHVATLTDFVALRPSPNTARPALGNVIFNTVDAATAELRSGTRFGQSYLPARKLPNPHGTAIAQVNDRVFKVGRTTGLTHGMVTAVASVVGPIPYAPGGCWFSQQIEIQGVDGTMFSNHGDSGSLILRDSGEVIGLLYAGNGTHTFACPIDDVLVALNCSLV